MRCGDDRDEIESERGRFDSPPHPPHPTPSLLCKTTYCISPILLWLRRNSVSEFSLESIENALRSRGCWSTPAALEPARSDESVRVALLKISRTTCDSARIAHRDASRPIPAAFASFIISRWNSSSASTAAAPAAAAAPPAVAAVSLLPNTSWDLGRGVLLLLLVSARDAPTVRRLYPSSTSRQTWLRGIEGADDLRPRRWWRGERNLVCNSSLSTTSRLAGSRLEARRKPFGDDRRGAFRGCERGFFFIVNFGEITFITY